MPRRSRQAKVPQNNRNNQSIQREGVIVQVIGAVVDVQYSGDYLAHIYEAVHVFFDAKKTRRLVLEVAAHLGDNRVRAVALGPTDGLKRGDRAEATGGPITVPVGKKTLGRLFNVVGEAIDEKGEVTGGEDYPIPRPAPT